MMLANCASVSTILLAHLRTFVRPARDIPSDSCTEISITLSVLQGLSLLDGGCKRGVSTTAAMEVCFVFGMRCMLTRPDSARAAQPQCAEGAH